MTQLQQFLFELSFGQTRKIREYMLKRYNVYCGSMKDLEQAERYAASNMYGGMAVKSVELKQENSNGK